MSEKHYSFFQNRECEYFPCHKDADPETFNCLFCYCPLYALGRKCGGNFRYTKCIKYKKNGNNCYDSCVQRLNRWPMLRCKDLQWQFFKFER